MCGALTAPSYMMTGTDQPEYRSVTESNRAVFLSYASEDAAAAQRICAALRAAGIEVWFDQSELRGGDAWDATIRRQIKSCALFIPIISRHSHARAEGYFRLEWKLAVDRSHLIAVGQALPGAGRDRSTPRTTIRGCRTGFGNCSGRRFRMARHRPSSLSGSRACWPPRRPPQRAPPIPTSGRGLAGAPAPRQRSMQA